MKTLRISSLLLLAGFFSGCSIKVQPQADQNVLLITVDTLRADRLGCYGYTRGATPHMDRLAERGVLFERAMAQVPLTLPSHVSLLTGTYPPVNGVRDNTYFRLDPKGITLAEMLESAGYQTGAFVGAFVLDGSFGLSQGFSVYDDRMGAQDETSPGTFHERSAVGVTRAFLSWLEELDGEGPFFAWVHLFDPHTPYAPPSPFRERFVSSPYDGEIAYVDEQVGSILRRLESLGLREDTLIVLTADHGESLGEHGERTHGFFVYDSTLKVPLILTSHQSLPAGRSVSAQVRLVDVLPTILELVDLAIPAEVQGKSLLGIIDGDDEQELAAYGECYAAELNFGWAPLTALRQEGFKYIEAPRPELYDVTSDPNESQNLLSAQPERAKQMKAALASLLESWPETYSARHQPDPETIAKLRSLGYAAGGQNAAGRDPNAPDPKDRLHVWDKSQWVIHHMSRGDYDEATGVAESILDEDPTNLLAMEHLAYCFKKQGSPAKAMELYRRILSLAPDRPVPHLYLGNLLWLEGRLVEAEGEFRAALETDSRFARAYERLGYLKLSKGETQEALERFAEALRIEPERTQSRLGLARTHRATKNLDAARVEYERLVESRPADGEALGEYAHMLAQAGKIQEAERMLRSGPDHFQVHYTLSLILRETERMSEALVELDKTITLKPDLAPAHHDRGVILSRLGRIEDAIPSFQKALRLHEDPLTRNALGTSLCRVDRCLEAIPHFERAVELAPGYREALENLAEALKRRASGLRD